MSQEVRCASSQCNYSENVSDDHKWAGIRATAGLEGAFERIATCFLCRGGNVLFTIAVILLVLWLHWVL
jgi:hypothetical protein